jgi:hypothetical protein
VGSPGGRVPKCKRIGVIIVRKTRQKRQLDAEDSLRLVKVISPSFRGLALVKIYMVLLVPRIPFSIFFPTVLIQSREFLLK